VKTALLDVNILTALFWPAHEHHALAHAWFRRRGHARWATCPLTQLGFVRLVTNPAFSRDALSPVEAIALLSQNVGHAQHDFWSESLPLQQAVRGMEPRLHGFRQLTDAYLLALAHQRKGMLATFDQGLRSLAHDQFSSALDIVPTA
jgi:toxin-antitoxin system PIN domain toxin